MSNETRIYVASLSDYNAGTLHGAWIDVDGDTTGDEIDEQIAAMLAASPTAAEHGDKAEEYEIHDHEGWEGLDPARFALADLPGVAKGLDAHGEMFAEILTGGYVSDNDPAAAIEFIEENYRGTFTTVEVWAENYISDTGVFDGVSDTFRQYFDFKAFARDAVLGGDIFTVDTRDGVAVFDNR